MPMTHPPCRCRRDRAIRAGAGGHCCAPATWSPCSARSARARRRSPAACCAGSASKATSASPTFPIVQAYAPPDTRLPLWHVDLYRIERAGEIEELGLDEARDDAALLIEWPERLPRLWPEALRLTLDVRAGRRARLDSLGAARLGRAMAAPMIPPPHAPDFLAAHGWEGCEIRPLAGDASFRRYFRVVHGDGARRC